jgi:hypothetical protein
MFWGFFGVTVGLFLEDFFRGSAGILKWKIEFPYFEI